QDPAVERRGETPRPDAADDLDPRMMEVLDEVPGLVGRVVVHDDDLGRVAEAREDAPDGVQDVLPLVERGEHDGDSRIKFCGQLVRPHPRRQSISFATISSTCGRVRPSPEGRYRPRFQRSSETG